MAKNYARTITFQQGCIGSHRFINCSDKTKSYQTLKSLMVIGSFLSRNLMIKKRKTDRFTEAYAIGQYISIYVCPNRVNLERPPRKLDANNEFWFDVNNLIFQLFNYFILNGCSCNKKIEKTYNAKK